MAALPCVQEVADPGHVRALFRAASGRRQSLAAWSLLFYALWHRAHIEEILDRRGCIRFSRGEVRSRVSPLDQAGALGPNRPRSISIDLGSGQARRQFHAVKSSSGIHHRLHSLREPADESRRRRAPKAQLAHVNHKPRRQHRDLDRTCA